MTQSALNLTTKRTRERELLAQFDGMAPCAALVQIVAPHSAEGKKSQPPYSIETILKVHFIQQWVPLSDPAMEEALHDMPLFREFVSLTWDSHIPYESTILRFHHLLEMHKRTEQIAAAVNGVLLDKGLMLEAGTAVDANLIAASNSIKNPERRARLGDEKGNQWHFGMKAHIGVDAESGLVHTVRGTSGNADDVVEVKALLHVDENVVFADPGYRHQGWTRSAR